MKKFQSKSRLNKTRTDPLSPAERSDRMSKIRSKNTKPELALRRLVFKLGYRYRLHTSGIPGRPDLVFAGRRAVIFVHGCFWHQHDCGTYKMPLTRRKIWEEKLIGNAARDAAVIDELRAGNWRVLVVWECELRNDVLGLGCRLIDFLEGDVAI